MANPGFIPLSELTAIPGYQGIYLLPLPARQFMAMARDFKERRGNDLVPNEGYRPMNPTPGLPGSATGYFFARYRRVNFKTGIYYDGSYWQKLAGVPAAGIPGTSPHLKGNAVDVDIYSFSSADYDTLEAIAPFYGFSLAQGVADREPWHIVFVGGQQYTAPSMEEEDMFTDADRAMLNLIKDSVGPGIEGVRHDSEQWKQGRDTQNMLKTFIDRMTPGVEHVKTDGDIYEQEKWTFWNTNGILALLNEMAKHVGINEKELARELAPLVNIAAMNDEDFIAIAQRVNDEADRRDRERLSIPTEEGK